MNNIIKSHLSSFSIFKSALSWLISSNIKLPCFFWHIIKILIAIDIHPIIAVVCKCYNIF